MPRKGALLDLLADILIDQGYAARTILDGAPGRAARPEQPPALIGIDLALPARTVTAVRASARGYDLSGVPVVITTTSPAAGGGESLLKPFDLDDLLARGARYVQLPHRETQRGLSAPAPRSAARC